MTLSLFSRRDPDVGKGGSHFSNSTGYTIFSPSERGLSPLDYDAALSLPYGAIVINNLLLTASYGTGSQATGGHGIDSWQMV